MKQETNFGYILRLTLTLLLICAVVAAALAGVNAITKDKIAAAKAEKTQRAIQAVLPGVNGVKEVPFTDATGLVTKVYKSDMSLSSDSDSAFGYAVEVTPAGFGGTITMMVGVDNAGKVLGISIISHAETASLGSVAADNSGKGIAFREQFIGMSGTLAVTKDGGSVDAITSATITSRAVTNGVNIALACVAALG
jgi:electron transport complex protein RnfG